METERKIGYIRVSSADQNAARQLEALENSVLKQGIFSLIRKAGKILTGQNIKRCLES